MKGPVCAACKDLLAPLKVKGPVCGACKDLLAWVTISCHACSVWRFAKVQGLHAPLIGSHNLVDR